MDHLLLTRRQTLQSLAFSSVFGGSLLGLIGCGGSGGHGGGGVQTQTTHVPVTLPAGFSLPLSELEVGTAFGKATLDATGFSGKVNAKAPTFAYVRHKPTGKFVLFGLVGAGRPGVTPLATAALSMAIAFGLTGLPGANVAQALTLLEADTNVQGLGTAIAAAMAADPYAVNGDNAGVGAAIKAAYDALAGTGSRAAATAMAKGVSRASDAPIVLVTPSDEQGGFRVDQGDDDDTVVPTNLKRRPATAYTYRIGHDPGVGQNDGTAAARVDVQELPPTTTILGSLVSLGVKGAYGPVKGKSVDLPISSPDDKTYYQTVVLMASGDQGGEPNFFGLPRYANELADWRQKRKDLNTYAWIGGILGDVFAAAAVGTAVSLTIQHALAIAADMEAAAAAAGRGFLAAVQSGAYGQATQDVLTLVKEGDILGTRLLNGIEEILGIPKVAAGTAEGTTLIGLATVALATLSVAVGVFAVGDVAASYYDLLASPQGVLWDETVLKPGVRISPRKAELRQGSSLTLSANVVGAEGAGTVYTWSLSGGVGTTLRDDAGGQAGSKFDTSSTSVVLVTTPSTQGTLKVTVSAKSSGGKNLGSDVATITMTDSKEPVKESGTFKVDSGAYDDIPNGAFINAIVTFAEVPGATVYSVHGEGGNDIAYGTSIDLTYDANHGYVDGNGKHPPFTVGLAGTSAHTQDVADSTAYYQGRFAAFKFTVTAYFT